MEIRELVRLTSIPGYTIRYYETIGVLPPPHHKANGCRDYSDADVERVRLVAGARSLCISLDDIAEIMGLRDRREAPCRVVIDLLEQKTREVARRIEALQQLEVDLRELHPSGQTFPLVDVDGKACVCHLVCRASPSSDCMLGIRCP